MHPRDSGTIRSWRDFPTRGIQRLAVFGVLAVLISAQAAPQEDPRNLRLEPRKSEVDDGGSVEFIPRIRGDWVGASFSYQVDFGDGRLVEWDRKSPLVHPYRYKVDQPYEARLIVGRKSGQQFEAVGQSPPALVFVRKPKPPEPANSSSDVPVETPTPPRPTLGISAAPNPAWAGETVRFSIDTLGFMNEDGSPLLVSLDPGDGTGARPADVKAAAHEFGAAGTYKMSATLAAINATGGTVVEVLPVPKISLEVPKEPLDVGETGGFYAIVVGAAPGLGLRYHLGGDNDPEVTTSAKTGRSYSSPGTRVVFVEIGRLGKDANGYTLESVLARSPDMKVEVRDPSTLEFELVGIAGFKDDIAYFDVRMSDDSAVGRFVFNPGDGSKPYSPGRPSFAHHYVKSGTFRASIDRGGDRKETYVTIPVWPPVVFWMWVAIATAVLATTTTVLKVKKLPPFRPKVRIVPKLDKPPEVKPGRRGPAFSFSVRAKRNPDSASGTIRNGSPQLIKFRRKRHE